MIALGPKLVIASHNRGKLREIADLIAPLGVEAISAAALDLPEPEETEFTFAGNAALKAHAAVAATGLPALSDDSGLEVNALGGMPGVFSARWAGPGKDFSVAIGRVEAALRAAGARDFSARFVCVLALARPGAETQLFEGDVRGNLTFPPRGSQGFGYDPIFIAEGETETFGEMAQAKKHAMSHRAKAFAKFLAALGG